MDPSFTVRRRGDEAGFTLVELLVVVAIIGLLASIAVPSLMNAMRKSKRNAAVSDLRVLRDAMLRYATDHGSYPSSMSFSVSTLAPLDRTYVKDPHKLLRLLRNQRLDMYFPWNVFSNEDFTLDDFTSPKGFFLMATLDYDPSIRFIVTDSTMYYYIGNKVTLIGDH